MDQIKIGKVYRHFKGNYYFVEDVAYDSETKERMVVYKPLYNREDNRQLWVRPEKMFLEEIPERPDNITGQKVRFELVKDIEKITKIIKNIEILDVLRREIMIDIKFLREHPDIVKENIKKKFQDNKLILVDEIIDLDIKIEKQN